MTAKGIRTECMKRWDIGNEKRKEKKKGRNGKHVIKGNKNREEIRVIWDKVV